MGITHSGQSMLNTETSAYTTYLSHICEIIYHLLTRCLNARSRNILGVVGVDVSDECGEGRTPLRVRSGVDDIGLFGKS